MGVPGVQVIGVGAAGGVGPGLKNGGGLHALLGGGGALDQHLDQVGLAVAVGVHGGLHIHHFPDDGVIGEDGLGLAVDEQGRGGLGLDGLPVLGGQLRHLLQGAFGQYVPSGQSQTVGQGAVIVGPGADLFVAQTRPAHQGGGRLQRGGGTLGLEGSAAAALHQALGLEQIGGALTGRVIRHVGVDAGLGLVGLQLLGVAAQLYQLLCQLPPGQTLVGGKSGGEQAPAQRQGKATRKQFSHNDPS